jgi:glucokinase
MIGVDVGGTKILAVRITDDGRIVDRHEVSTPSGAAALLAAIDDVIDRVSPDPPARVGLGLPGFLDHRGVAHQAPNLIDLVGLDVAGHLRARLGCPVTIDNDANCAAWAAWRLEHPRSRCLVAVTFGTGIGGGIVVDGTILRGAHGFAGEPGHMIVAAGGRPCVCGQRGCWEAYASGRALAAACAAAGVSSTEVAAQADAGDPAAIEVISDYAGWVAVGLVNVANLFDPDVIVLGGGVAAQGAPLQARILAALDREQTFSEGREVSVHLSALGPDAGAIGAALLEPPC